VKYTVPSRRVPEDPTNNFWINW